jgi:hypothetical protein
MIFNNYFGFTGLQLFAQYVAVPVVALWAVYATIKVLTSTSGQYLAGVAVAARGAKAKAVLGYSRIEEVDAASAAAVGGAGGHGGS